MSFWKKLSHVASVVTAPVRVVLKPVTSVAAGATGLVGKVSARVPLIGKPIHGLLDATITGPLHAAHEIASGARIDRAAMSGLKTSLAGVKEVAPYAQIIVSQVPLVGTSVNSAIAAGIELAKGKRLDQALIAGVRAQLPASSQTLFDEAESVAALDGDPRPKLAEKLKTIKTEEGRKAFYTGMVVGHGKRLQETTNNAVHASLPDITKASADVLKDQPILKAGDGAISDQQARYGFRAGVSAALHNTPKEIFESIRRNLSSNEKKGFDLALAAKLGQDTKQAPAKLSDREKFGYYAAHGMLEIPKDKRLSVLQTITHDNSVHVGVQTAVAEMKDPSFWHKLFVKLHIAKHTQVAGEFGGEFGDDYGEESC